MNKFRDLLRPSRSAAATAGWALIILVGALDHVTGSQISLSVFYLLPISLITWFTDRRGGIVAAVLSAATWLLADLTSTITFAHPLIPYWNAIVRLLVFLMVVYLESALKTLNQDLEGIVKDRTALLAAEVTERKKVEERLQQYTKRLKILHEIDRAILSAQSLDEVVQESIRRVQNLLPCDRVSFALLEFDSRQAVVFETPGVHHSQNPFEKRIPIESIPDLNAIVLSLRQGDVQLHNDLCDSPNESSVTRNLRVQGYRSLLIVPTLVQDELIGSLNLVAHQPNAFPPECLEIGREVANQLGIAITQARMMDQLRIDQENLQALSQRLLEVQEQERRNIARELHDEVGQTLTGLALILDVATQSPAGAITSRFGQAHALVIELTERVRQLSLELRPALLDDLGLLPALLWYLDRYSSQTGIQAILKHNGLEEQRFAPQVETAAYRIVQEALTNVARHAHVEEARVTLWFDQGTLGVQVEDAGRGFLPETTLTAGNSSGLLGMRERATLLNGKLIIESALGLGTRLLAELPASGFLIKEN